VRRATRSAALLALAWLAVPLPAGADSDFWDEVREPGLRAYRDEVARAEDALARRRFDEAVLRATAAAERLPGRPEAHVVLLTAHGRAGQLREAVLSVERALRASPDALDQADVGELAAGLAARAGSYQLAAELLERQVGRLPEGGRRTRLYLLYGDVLSALGPAHLASAIAAYREVLRQGTRPGARAELGLAICLERGEATVEAGDLARRAAQSGRFEAEIRTAPLPQAEKAARLAIAYLAIGDREGARRAFREAAAGPWREHAVSELRALGGRLDRDGGNGR